MSKAILTGKGRRWVERGHPWVYSDDIAAAEGTPGELVPVSDPNENPLGWALFSNSSRIALRFVTRLPEQPTRAFWKGRLQRALRLRERAGLLAPAGACRLVHGDSDGLPGWVVDRYADVLVMQCSTQGADRMRDFLLELLTEVLVEHDEALRPSSVLDRSDVSIRRLEDLPERVEWLTGEPRGEVLVREPDPDGGPELAYEVDVLEGHKTGHYLDQSVNRRLAARQLEGARVLDAFSYDGLFGVRAALAGASEVLCLDQSAGAGERVLRNAERNGVAERVGFERANAMKDLKRREYAKESWDVVIVDPPAFARNKREAEGAARGYRELNRRAAALVAPGGRLVSASCSFNVSQADFLKYLGQACLDARRGAWISEVRGAAQDHPVHVHLPESGYLKCAFLEMDGLA